MHSTYESQLESRLNAEFAAAWYTHLPEAVAKGDIHRVDFTEQVYRGTPRDNRKWGWEPIFVQYLTIIAEPDSNDVRYRIEPGYTLKELRGLGYVKSCKLAERMGLARHVYLPRTLQRFNRIIASDVLVR